ncbi:hypothetical protein LCGC14_1693600 [marine sediment metagenome]|uniref:Uncharacterized protein n=1 Tax=marine sediment metagenome TaxID=412755 RepID=A0A0F9HKM2_9ZZZZ
MFANIDLAVMFLFGIMAILVLILTWVSISHVKSLLFRTILVILFASFLPLGYSSLAELTGRPRPISLIWMKNHLISDIKELDAEILWYTFAEDEGIYLYLLLPNKKEPLSIVLPWNKKQAKRLKEGMRNAREKGGKLRMKLSFENSLDRRGQMFYELPQPTLPLKAVPGAPLQFRDRPGGRSSRHP